MIRAAIAVPVAVLLGVLAFIALSAWMFYPSWERAFMSDRSPVSWLSSALLLTLCVVALLSTTEQKLPTKLGWWLVLSFFVLALDEQFMLHELWKYKCHEWTALCHEQTMNGFNHWVREAPMLLVGLVGSAACVLLYRAMSDPLPRSLLMSGLCVGLFAIVIDQWSGIPTELAVFEEAFEVIAEALVLTALMTCRSTNKPYVQSKT